MGLVNALWDNRDQIAVEPQEPAAAELPDQPGGDDD